MLKYNIIIGLLIVSSSIAYAGLAADLLCDTAIKYYREGDKEEALKAFKKILIVEPNNHLALEYIDLIEGETAYPVREPGFSNVVYEPEEIGNESGKEKNRGDMIFESIKELERNRIIEKELDMREEVTE